VDRLPFALAHHMSLLPLLWLGVLAYYRQHHSVLWWTFALVLGVSWLADTAAHWVDPWLVSRIYPLVQALVLGVVLLPLDRLWRLLLVLAGAYVVSAATAGPDIVTHTIAWTSILVMVWPAADQPRRMMALIFLGNWLGWIAYTIASGWWSWGLYQGLRAAGLGVFCWASAPAKVRA
jgi:hypothetical protein